MIGVNPWDQTLGVTHEKRGQTLQVSIKILDCYSGTLSHVPVAS